MRALMAVAACALFLSACGIKGPLFLPPADPTPNATANELPDGEPSTNDSE